MSSIKGVLEELNCTPDIKGSAVVMQDGIMVASALESRIPDDVVAGLVSFLVSTTRRSLKEGGLGEFSRFVMNSTHGKVIVVDVGEGFLVAITDQFAKLESCMDGVQEAALRLRRMARISI